MKSSDTQIKDFLKTMQPAGAVLGDQIKKKIMKSVDSLTALEEERTLFTLLRKQYTAVAKKRKEGIKHELMLSIFEQSHKSPFDQFVNHFFLLGRKLMATSFAALLLIVTVIAPFQTLQSAQILPVVQAAYMECKGMVIVNGTACQTGSLLTISPGDFIETGKKALATIFYADYAVVRIDENSEATVNTVREEQIHLAQGGLWVNAPTENREEPLRISTPVLKAQVPHGAAGVTSHRNFTRLVSASAVVEVQIDNPHAETEIVTVAPESAVSVRKTRNTARVNQLVLRKKDEAWVEKQTEQDQLHLDIVKKVTVEKEIADAGALPGGVRDYVDKFAQSARTAFVWDEDTKQSMHLSELDELFSEIIVLLEKGDETTARETFEVYREKISSHLSTPSAKISVNKSNEQENLYIALLKEHSRIVSPFTAEDTQYVLKKDLKDLALSVISPDGSVSTDSIVTEATAQKLIDAHQVAKDGDIKAAETILIEAAELESKAIADKNSDDLVLLDEIADQAYELQPLVTEIKKEKLKKLKAVEPAHQKQQIVTNYLTGTAYKTSEEPEDGPTVETSKIVGQAVRPKSNL